METDNLGRFVIEFAIFPVLKCIFKEQSCRSPYYLACNAQMSMVGILSD